MSNGLLPRLAKSLLRPQQWRALRRAVGRGRWILKTRLVFHYRFPVLRRPLVAARYIFLDPEVESYTYPVANEAELAESLAPILGVTRTQVQAWFDEVRTDPYISRDRGWRWSCKRRLHPGNRLAYYPVVRAIKPKLIVEAGVHEGMASEIFLAALRRNAQEGAPGRLMSFDIHDDTGWLVHPDLHNNWQRIIGSTLTDMEPALHNLQVDLFLHDTMHWPEMIGLELDVILRHAAEKVAVMDSSGLMQPTLREYCGRFGVEHHHMLDVPMDHVVVSHGVGMAIFANSAGAEKSCLAI